MRKMEFHADTKEVEKFIKEMSELFPNHDVNLNNVNDFAIMHQERLNCINCKGLDSCKNNLEGNFLDYENNEFVVKECKYKIKERAKRSSLIKALYLPDNILDAKLEDFDTNCDSRKKIYKEIIDNTGKVGDTDLNKGLYLYGGFSKGKTYALAVIANELAKKNIESLLIYFPDLVLDLKNALSTPRFEELMNMLKDIDVLMLDDLGSENITPWIRDEILGPVINYRMMAHKPLYISSNLNPSELVDHLSINGTDMLKAKRIASRMNALLKSMDMDDSKVYKR